MAEIFYYDIGDYLSREEKLKIISDFKDISHLPFVKITPNEHGDWISKRNDKFSTWIALAGEKKEDEKSQSFFTIYSLGCATNRDSWVYNFSQKKLKQNVVKTISHYNSEANLIYENKKTEPEKDSLKGNWTRDWLNALKQKRTFNEQECFYTMSSYRPFVKQNFYFDDDLIQERYKQPKLFPTPNHKNLLICTQSISGKNEYIPLITNTISDLHFNGDTQCFPLYYYEEIAVKHDGFANDLFADSSAISGTAGGTQYVRHDGISDFILKQAQTKHGGKVTKEDIFYYVYGILHSKSYRNTFAADLKKTLPCLPLVSDYQKFWAFVKAGRDLSRLHLEYETVPHLADAQIDGTEKNNFTVTQMKFSKIGKEKDKSTILFNGDITIKNIPPKVYEYTVNGKSAVEWIMERYAVTTDAKSGITNDPNDWAAEHQKPRYILDLLLSVMNVSVQTVDIVNGLPEVDWEKE